MFIPAIVQAVRYRLQEIYVVKTKKTFDKRKSLLEELAGTAPASEGVSG